MPTPAKTSPEQIVQIANDLVVAGGAEALTMGAVARAAGVRTPSLYKHFVDRQALLKAVELELLAELEGTLRRETSGETPALRLASIAAAYRRFAKAAPHRYRAIYGGEVFNDPLLREAIASAARPLFEELLAAGVAEARILPLARTFTAFMHGFVLMEIGDAFRLGGDVDDAFDSGVTTLLRDL